MNKKLYVGSLPYETTAADLQSMFEEAGKVKEAAIITDRISGRSRGFGFVEMEDEKGAAAAIEKFNGHEMDGRKIVVNEARPPRQDRGPAGR